MTRNGARTLRATTAAYQSVTPSKPRLNQRAGANRASPECGRSSEAVCEGVRIIAAASDSIIAVMMVTENCR